MKARSYFIPYENLMAKLDLFGIPVSLNVFSREKFSTSLGFISTILITTLTLFILVTNIIQAVNQSTPNSIYSEELLQTTPAFPLRDNNFTFGISLTYPNLSSMAGFKIYYDIEYRMCYRNRVLKDNQTVIEQGCTVIPASKCELGQHFSSQAQYEFFKNHRLQNTFCMNISEWRRLQPVIQGTGQELQWKYLSLFLTPCRNTSTQQTCAPVEEQKAIMKNGLYVSYLSTNLVDDTKRGNPFAQHIFDFHTTFSGTAKKTLFSEYNEYISRTDVGLVSTNTVEDTVVVYADTTVDTDQFNDDYYVRHTVRLENKRRVSNRRYEKLYNIVGTVGGLWSVFYYILMIAISPLVKILMKLKIANMVFLIEENQQEKQSLHERIKRRNHQRFKQNLKKSKNQNNTKINNSQMQPADNKLNSTVQNEETIKVEEYINYYIDKQKGQKIGVKSLFDMYMSNLESQRKYFQNMVLQLNDYLDITYIIGKIKEIEKLKTILLNENQLKLFDYLLDPNLSQSSSIQKDLFGQKNLDKNMKQNEKDKENSTNKIMIAYDAFQQLINQPKDEKVDSKILQLLDQDIIELFRILQHNKKIANDFRTDNNAFYDIFIPENPMSPVKLDDFNLLRKDTINQNKYAEQNE